MTWDDFYEHLDELTDDTLIREISALEDFPRSDYIADVASDMYSDAANLLVSRAFETGMVFTLPDLFMFYENIDQSLIDKIIERLLDTDIVCDYDDLRWLESVIGKELLSRLLKTSVDNGAEYPGEDLSLFNDMVDHDVVIYAIDRKESSDLGITKEDLKFLADIVDEERLTSMIAGMLNKGISFSYQDIDDLFGYISDEQISVIALAQSSNGDKFTPAQIRELMENMNDKDWDGFVLEQISNGVVYSPKDIVEAQYYVDDSITDKIAAKSLAAGVRFTSKDVVDLRGAVSDTMLTRILKSVKTRIPSSDLKALEGEVDQALLEAIDRRQGTHVFVGRPKHKGPTINITVTHTPEVRITPVSKPVIKKKRSRKRSPGLLLGTLELMSEILTPTVGKGGGFKVGDHVWIRYRDQEGIIIGVDKGNYLVSVHGGRNVISCPGSQLKRSW